MHKSYLIENKQDAQGWSLMSCNIFGTEMRASDCQLYKSSMLPPLWQSG
jgi:hypothetical protein